MFNGMYFLQEKESLLTELRKELRLSNEEHRELLGRVNADDILQRIRSDSVMYYHCCFLRSLLFD